MIKKIIIWTIITLVWLTWGYVLYITTDEVRSIKNEISSIDRNILEAEQGINNISASIQKTILDLKKYQVLKTQFEATKDTLEQERTNKVVELQKAEENRIFNF